MPVIDGDANANTLTGTSGSDTINAYDGNDTVNLSDGADTVDGGAGSDSLNGFLGSNGWSATTGPATYTITASGITGGTLNTTFSNIERLTLFASMANFGDTIDASAWVPASGPGFFSLTIFTGNGNDTITGSAYADSILAGGGANVVDAGAGTDYVTIAANAALAPSIMVTTDGGAVLVSQAGTVTSRVSNAEVVFISPGTAAGLTINAAAVPAGAASLLFSDSIGSDTVTGSTRADSFSTTAGSTPNLGHDVYTGNGGADLYSFINGGASGLDGTTIVDFDA